MNSDVLAIIRSVKVPRALIADEIGLSESRYFAIMRHKLTPERRKQILLAVKKLARPTPEQAAAIDKALNN